MTKREDALKLIGRNTAGIRLSEFNAALPEIAELFPECNEEFEQITFLLAKVENYLRGTLKEEFGKFVGEE